MLKLVERHFWILIIAVTLLAMFLPQVGRYCNPKLFLAGILFFTGLKIDFAAALRELKRPLPLLYLSAMMLIVLPLAFWLVVRAVVPDYALGLLVLAAMPAGMACSSLTDVIRGNPALALVLTLVTSLLCPITAPLVVGLGGGRLKLDSFLFFARQAGFLAVILFTPMAAAYAVRRLFPAFVARHREGFTGLSILSLCLVVLGTMGALSEEFFRRIHDSPDQVVKLAIVLVGFSASMHLVGYFLTPGRSTADRAAVSINSAYVNNGLGMVFARQFFNPIDALPAVLLEIPMVLFVKVLAVVLGRRLTGQSAAPVAPTRLAAPAIGETAEG